MIKTWGLLSKLREENRLMKLAVFVLALALFVESILIYRAAQTQKVIILPPRVDKEFWVSGNEVSNAYLEQVGLYIADRLLSVSSENVDFSLNTIMPFMTTEPQLIKAIKDKFIEFTRIIKVNNISQIFYPVKVDIKKDELIIDGTLKKLTGNVLMSETKPKLKLKYTINNGRFVILNIELTEQGV